MNPAPPFPPRFLPPALLFVVGRDAAYLVDAVLGHDPREGVADDGPEGGREGGREGLEAYVSLREGGREGGRAEGTYRRNMRRPSGP